MKRYYLIEENLPPKLPLSFSSKIKKQINLIKDYNQDNPDSLSQWYEYIDNLKNYISHRKIAWDYANRYTHFPNGAVHLVELGFDASFIVSIDKVRNINYVYVFRMDLKPQEFGLKIPPTTEHKQCILRLTESQFKEYLVEKIEKVLVEIL